MSTTFILSGSSFDRKTWEQALRALLLGQAGWVPLNCMGRLYPDAATEPFKNGGIMLLGKGSSRGVQVEAKDGQVSVELMTFASEVDWDAARWLLLAGSKLGAQVSCTDDGVPIGQDDLKSEPFQARCQKVLHAELAMTRGLMAKDGGDNVRFPVAHFVLCLPTVDLMSKELNTLMESLVKQCFLYGSAFIASRMKWQKPDGTSCIGANYADMATLVPADAQFMTFSGPEGMYTHDLVPMDKVKEVLAQFITPVGDFLFLPPIPWEQQPTLLEALTSKSTKEIRQSLDLQFAETLLCLPVLAFILVASADGEADLKEMQTFLDYVKRAGTKQDDQTLFATACRRLPQEMEGIMIRMKRLNHLEHLAEFQCAVRQLDHRLGPESSPAFKDRLFELAETVAKASGGGFLGIGSKINEAEQQALTWLQKTLSAPENQ